MEFKPGMVVIHTKKNIRGVLINETEAYFSEEKAWRVDVVDYYASTKWYESNLIPVDTTNRQLAQYLLRQTEEII